MTSFTHTLLLFYNLLFSFNVQIFFILLVSTSSTTSNWSKSTHIRTGISGAISIDPPEQGIQEFSMTIKNATGIYYRTNILRIYPRYHIRNLLPRKIIFRQSFGKYSKRRRACISYMESTVVIVRVIFYWLDSFFECLLWSCSFETRSKSVY